ncbi:MAG: DUF885 domain-containing protein [Cyclobacteriaceae bacterium]
MKIKTLNAAILMLSIAFIWSCAPQSEEKTYSPEEIVQASKAANEFFDRVFDEAIDRSPEYQSYLGIKKDYGKWDDRSPENEKIELKFTKENLAWAKANIDREALDHQTKISYDLFVQDSENQISDYKYRLHNYPIHQMRGNHTNVASMLINIHRISDSSDAAAYISRLNGVEQMFDQVIENLKERETAGIVPPKFIYPYAIEASANIIKGFPIDKSKEQNTLYEDFLGKLDKIELDPIAKAQLTKGAQDALVNNVKPAYDKLIAFLKEQETRATTDDGAWKFPDGKAYYNNALKRTTTTDLTAEEIHQTGLREVARIHGEMKDIMKQVDFEGTLQEFFTFLKTDEQFYYPNTDEGKIAYIDSATTIINNMKQQLDALFITKPKAEIVVKRVEAFREQSAGKAFYQAPAPDGSRPGTYYANLYNSKNMPKYEMEALAYHEGIPGHHMDRTIAQELTGIPKFRKFGGYTAYVEGWGLYCEFIPKEMGMYSNPYADYGRLAMELWRACRLVVDTGIHTKKWTREEGIEYYLTNTSGSERECVRMVERHIVMPSQATAYKIGMLKILELRAKAKTAMGEKFDIREFHDVVLTSGSVPLSVLEDLVDKYIASKAS